MKHVAIIGAGAAGCFAAIRLRALLPAVAVTVYEGGTRPLAKVAITGGGRCNLTNTFADVTSLAAVYPRGERLMRGLFHAFGPAETRRWFEEAGVRLVEEGEGCLFPRSQDAGEIVRLLLRRMAASGVTVSTGHRVATLRAAGDAAAGAAGGFRLTFADATRPDVVADAVLVASGGSPRRTGLDFLAPLGLRVVDPVPSLYGLGVADAGLTALAGTVVARAAVALAATRHRATGALLITHRGVSGPAVLRLTSYAARTLHDGGYQASLVIDWTGGAGEEATRTQLAALAAAHPGRQVATAFPRFLNRRLWAHLLVRADLEPSTTWGAVGAKAMRRLASRLTSDAYAIAGRDPHRAEFVTCGGVSLAEIHPATMECRRWPGLFAAGEVLDVDAVTGGYNLQAAWTMGHVAASGIAARLRPRPFTTSV